MEDGCSVCSLLSLYARVLLRKTRAYRERELILYTVKDECARVRRISDRALRKLDQC